MRRLSTTLALTLAAAISAGVAARADMPVVVEFFTSQGCSSCPPADELMGELAARPDVVALAYHVDYWNYIGWVDPFSDPAWTDRQRNYARLHGTSMVYTPQAMIQGMTDVIGSRRDDLQRVIEIEKAKSAVASVTFAQAGDRVDLSVGQPQAEALDVILVAYRSRTETVVTRGENAGRTLVGHNVVGSVQDVGDWNGAALSLPLDLSGLEAAGFDGIAVLLQGQESGAIYAAAKRATAQEPLISQGIEDGTSPANVAGAAGSSGGPPGSAVTASDEGDTVGSVEGDTGGKPGDGDASTGGGGTGVEEQ